MKKCSSYHLQPTTRYTYHPLTGRPIAHDVEVGVCWGTKECDQCDCSGDMSQCDFYSEVRKKALQGREPKFGEWISVDDRLPTEDEYLTHHNDGLDTLKRITIAYMTDTIEYTIGCYDGYKWVNQLGNKKINNVVAWKPFEIYEPPKVKGGAD